MGEQVAHELLGSFLRATVERALRTKPLLTPVGVASPDERLADLREKVDRRLPLWPQGRGVESERIGRAVERAFRGGAERVVVLRDGVPDLPLAFLLSAVRSLDRHDVVLGPADRGEYYLIAMNFPITELFEGINWGSGMVLHETVRSVQARGLDISYLPRWSLVSEPEDLVGLHNRLRFQQGETELTDAVSRAVQALD